jgi:hypothetical protein
MSSLNTYRPGLCYLSPAQYLQFLLEQQAQEEQQLYSQGEEVMYNDECPQDGHQQQEVQRGEDQEVRVCNLLIACCLGI